MVSWVGPWWLVCWASVVGSWPSKFFPLFFCFYSFLFLYFLCYVSYLNFNSFFADSEFRSALKYANDIIGPNMCYYIYHVCALAHKILKKHWDLNNFPSEYI
jgi:hypothetical protein